MKLRIPLFLLILGIFYALTNWYPQVYLSGNSLINKLQFYAMVGLTLFILEKLDINSKKVNVFVGLLLIAFGALIDYFF